MPAPISAFRLALLNTVILSLPILCSCQIPSSATGAPAATPILPAPNPPIAYVNVRPGAPFPAGTSNNVGTDPQGNPLRLSLRTGHISNFDESKVPPYVLPDVLTLSNGQPVKDAAAWNNLRRPELLKIYRSEIYGKVPDNAPKISWQVVSTDPATLAGASVRHLLGTVGDKPNAPKIPVTLVIPNAALAGNSPVPIVLCINFGGGGGAGARGRGRGTGATTGSGATSPAQSAPAPGPNFPPYTSGDPVSDILQHGYAYANVVYTDIQPDAVNTFTQGVIGQTLADGQAHPASGDWGTISAWAWGLSHIIDYFETDKSIDAKQVAIMGHSRLGKTVIWAGAQDPRIALVFSSCGGELGTALARRDFGETVDDMAQNFPWQFGDGIQKYAGHWNLLPVDAHMVIALNAPHPVFINGGTTDQWSDPKGEFLAEVAAGPVYRLVGKSDLGTSQVPPLDTPLITGDLGFQYHNGGHAALPIDWQAFLKFSTRYFKSPLAK